MNEVMTETFYTQSIDSILEKLESHPTKGLSQSQANQRLEIYGKNQLTQKASISKWTILMRQLKSIIVLLLTCAAIISFSLGQYIEGLSVVLVLIINTIMGYVTELKAVRSMESLKKIGHTLTHIIREGHPITINAAELVPGDILILEAGDMITADARLIESSRLAVDESILTGESVPVDKEEKLIETETLLAERFNMLYRGTSITRGTATAIVTATGMKTELGKIAKLTQEAKEETTPLEEKLNKLGQQLVWVSLFISFLIVIGGLSRGKSLFIMLETALALAIAAIPEGLPIVATMALAKGMWRMASKNALINKLSVVETLGATSVIFTDKTGTLTENKMTVEKLVTPHGILKVNEDPKNEDDFKDALRVATLCNGGLLGEQIEESIGDPMEVALLQFAKNFGLTRERLLAESPEVLEVAFDSISKMMATIHKEGETYFTAVKGAPESVFKHTSPHNFDLPYWEKQNLELSLEGLRLLALACKRGSIRPKEEDVYQDLHFLGLLALVDPARTDIKPALEKCHRAGIRVIMLTGDQEGTATKIAKDVHLTHNQKVTALRGDQLSTVDQGQLQNIDVFSRVSPEQKLELITYYQKMGQIVAMTGDGVNDAPALKKADIGMAMGIRGTQVAKDASDMILKDDQFKTIVEGVKQGRIIFSNIRRFVVYLLSCNLSEVLVVSLASVIDAPLPLTALQILFLNLVTDVFPALALGMGEGDSSYLKVPPRNASEPVITKRKWLLILFYGILITASVLGIFFYHLFFEKRPLQVALTTSFLTLGFGQVFHIFNMRLIHAPFLRNDITQNRFVWAAIALCSALLVGVVFIAPLRVVLDLVPLDGILWVRVLCFAFIPVIIGQIVSLFKWGIES